MFRKLLATIHKRLHSLFDVLVHFDRATIVGVFGRLVQQDEQHMVGHDDVLQVLFAVDLCVVVAQQHYEQALQPAQIADLQRQLVQVFFVILLNQFGGYL